MVVAALASPVERAPALVRRQERAVKRWSVPLIAAALLFGASPAAAAPPPDLVVTAASKAPKSAVAGARLKVTAAVRNRAGGRAARTRVGLYLSDNSKWSSSDVELTGSTLTAALPARRRVVLTVKVRVPRDAPPARRFKLLACADADRRLLEADERNNCRTAGSLIVVGGSAFDVIDAQVMLHRLSSPRALLYKLFAVFGDRRLPKRYRGDGSRVSGTMAVRTALERLPSLPPAIRARVKPFLIPPVYRGTVATKARAAQHEHDPADDLDACRIRASDWSSVETANGGARIWWRTASDDAADARRLARELGGTIWTSLTAVMTGHAPLPDGHTSCGGPDPKLDVYLWPLGHPNDGVTRPFSGSCTDPTASYVIVDPRAAPGALAHEFMHVLQYTYSHVGDCNRWMHVEDAVATWAEEHAYHFGQTEHESPELVADPRALFGYGPGYSGWAFVYSVTQRAGGSTTVRRLFELAKVHADPLDALDAALPGGLELDWPVFAKDAWNRPLLPDALKESFFNWDAWPVTPRVPRTSYRLKTRQWEGDLPIELSGLGRQYHDLDLSDRTAREIRFKDPSAVGTDPRLHTWAFLKVANRGWRLEDWTGLDKVEFCRDVPEEDVRQVVVVHSTTKRPPPGDPARTVTQSDKPKLRLKDRCEAGASLTLSGRGVYTVQHTDCEPTETTVMNWRLHASFELPGRVERGAPDPLDATEGAGSGSLAIDEVDRDSLSECPPLKHSTEQLEWRGDEGLALILLRKGGGLEVQVRMVYGFRGAGNPDIDLGIFGLGLGPDPFEDGVCKEIGGVIAASQVRERRISVPLGGTCDVRFGPDDLQHSVSQASGTLVITQ